MDNDLFSLFGHIVRAARGPAQIDKSNRQVNRTGRQAGMAIVPVTSLMASNLFG
jgi:hypothetical protein